MVDEPQQQVPADGDATAESSVYLPQPRRGAVRRRTALALTAGAAFVAGNVAYALGALLTVPDAPAPPGDELVERLQEQRERTLRSYLDEPAALLHDALAVGGPHLADVAAQHASTMARGDDRARAQALRPERVRRAREAAARQLAASDTAAGDPSYEALYGSAQRYAAAARSPLRTGAGAVTDPGRARDVGRGTVLQARLVNELASQPARGPAIAVLTSPGKLGTVVLPVGTQLHGAVRGSGNSDTRMFVDFSFARLSSGETFSLHATAADRQGREGIPGRKDLSRAAVGSVGLSAMARAGEAAGRTLAGSLGSILGAGVEGATSSTGNKVGRLDQDDYVVLVPKHTAIRVYVQDFARDAP